MPLSPLHRVKCASFAAGLLAICSAIGTARVHDVPSAKMNAWATTQRGANGFNKQFDEQWFADLNATGIRFCRLALGKAEGTGRDFLLGDADAFVGIPEADLQQTLQIVRWAGNHDIQVVIVPLSLPGARWSQQNGRVFDPKLWSDFKYHDQAATFWGELATALRDEPNVIGYEVLNEPAPERALDRTADEWKSDLTAIHRRFVGTPADVNELYARVVPAIRRVDRETPIVVSSSFFGFAGAVPMLKPIDDPHILYSFHTYEPFAYTNHKTNAGRFVYPGDVLTGDQVQRWDRERIRDHVAPVTEWARANRIPANRIFVGEFGCDRRVPGVIDYFTDSIAVFETHGWHWAFYGFREDE